MRLSFYNENRNWQIRQQRWSDQFNSTNAVNSVLSSALTNQSAGLAAISNHKALVRVTAQIKTAATNIANGLTPDQIAQLKSASSSLKATQASSTSTSNSLKATQASSAAGSSVNLLA